MAEAAVRVHCVAQEYWYIRRKRCDCGGRYVKDMHATLLDRKDVLRMRCEQCGELRDFVFDVSSFLPEHPVKSKLLLESELDAADREQILGALGNPMERAIEMMARLAEEGDSLALDYLTETVKDFKSKSTRRAARANTSE
jgi:hypothetical protein